MKQNEPILKPVSRDDPGAIPPSRRRSRLLQELKSMRIGEVREVPTESKRKELYKLAKECGFGINTWLTGDGRIMIRVNNIPRRKAG
tara:strand:+ start:421 stop:681 length:261 start_codon:yes stop_codon:yes gene_type:complete